jgi:hypothetical protein
MAAFARLSTVPQEIRSGCGVILCAMIDRAAYRNPTLKNVSL